jgi:uncharacterized membrane protein YfcA
VDAGSVAAAVALGFAGGVTGGLFGVGGGVLFVPALVFFLGLSQLSAESTSLMAIIPVAILGAWRQRSYGNVRMREALQIGVLSIVGVLLGTTLANNLPERALQIAFASLQLFFAFGLARRALRAESGISPRDGQEDPGGGRGAGLGRRAQERDRRRRG